MTSSNKIATQTKHQGPDHSAPYPVSRMAPAIELVDLAKEISQADNMLSNIAHGKLAVIAEQIKALQSQARTILEETELSHRLHNAHCGFKKIPGRCYHLYQKENAMEYFSMLSPKEWNNKPPHLFQGTFRLENDMSWTAVDENQPNKKEQPENIVEKFLEQNF